MVAKDRRFGYGLGLLLLASSLAHAQDAAADAAATVAAAAAPAAPVIDTGVTAWMLTSTALVLLMVPGLALFYGGLVRTKNVLGTMMHSFAAIAIVGVLWMLVGYALCFGSTIGGVIGWDPAKFMLSGIDESVISSYNIPEYVFAMFQGKFAIITPALIAGAFAERVRFRGYCIFIALWSLVVYSPLAHIVWGGGFLTGKAIDFAGGTVIHISAGVAGLVAALYLGARHGYPRSAMHPNNLTMTMFGAGLLWVGWFGFNAGFRVGSGLKTAQALAMTQIAAAAGALAWMIMEACHHRKATSLGFCSGILAGLVAITPAAGDVLPWGALLLGIGASLVCYYALLLKTRLGYDDSLDVFGIHGVAGIVGALGLTFMMRGQEGRTIMSQLPHQAAGVALAIVVSGVLTYVILVLVDKTVGLRLPQRDELAGMDHSLHGEYGYGLLNLN